MIEWIAQTSRGHVREKQEDSLGVWPKDNPFLFAVADGLGGHGDGDIASKTAIKTLLKQARRKTRKKPELRSLKAMFVKCHETIRKLNVGKPPETQMATTLSAACFARDKMAITHVGDSRVYRLRKGKMIRLTIDHALDASTLTQAVGLDKTLDIQTRFLKCQKEDLYLICSDGLHGMVPEDRIQALILQEEPLKARGKKLLKEALNNGGHDNVSLIIIAVK